MDRETKAVIFDMDGVIVNNHDYHTRAWFAFCQKFNITTSKKELLSMFGGTNKDVLEQMFGRTLERNEIDKLAGEKEELYRELYKKEIAETPGLTPFLERVKSTGLQVGLATSAPPSNVEFVLGKLNIGSYFTVIVDDSEIVNGKPHPETYLRAIKKLKLFPENCVVIEDSVRGIKSARAAGTRVIGITTTNSKEELSLAHHIIESFNELKIRDLFKLEK
jgi:beta-phosphoglucomutase family hydrolase